jgi:glycerophosphoryl diester phosphodiesterase
MLGSILRDLRSNWLQLLVVDSLYKLLAFLVLWPVWGLALRLFVQLSGRDDLADDDIVAFLLGPIGWAACIVVGTLWLAIMALQQAALMEVLAQRDNGVLGALRATIAHTPSVLRLAARISFRLFVVAAPFLAVGGAIYAWLLTEHDINYYLDAQPAEFWWAVGLIGGVLVAMSLVLRPALAALRKLALKGHAGPKHASLGRQASGRPGLAGRLVRRRGIPLGRVLLACRSDRRIPHSASR